MSCFCDLPMDTYTSIPQHLDFTLQPPVIPIQLKLATALIDLDMSEGKAQRTDVMISTRYPTIPKPEFAISGNLMKIALALNLAEQHFTIKTPDLLDFEMQQAAQSIQRNVWPRMGWMASLKMAPLLQMSLAARLKLKLELEGIDLESPAGPSAMANMFALPRGPDFQMKLALMLPDLPKLKLLAALPELLKLEETLDMPMLGDETATAMGRNRLMALASLTMPRINIPLKLMMKLAVVIDSLAVINEAFGEDAFTPSRMFQIRSNFGLYARLALPPLPIPDIMLTADQLADLPPFDDIVAGEKLVTNRSLSMMSNMHWPKLAIEPFLNLVVALRLKLCEDLDVPIPDGLCDACGSPNL